MPDHEALREEGASLKGENAVLRAQIEWLRKQVFGGGKSERLDEAQLTIKLAETEQAAVKLGGPRTVTYERKAPVGRMTPEEHFANLPVTETIELIPEEVKAAPERYERIGEERTFEVDLVAPQLVKREIVRPKYRLKDDRSVAPVVAPALKRVVEGGYASAGLIAWVALSKYVDHIPLYRLEQMSSRWSASISRQSMCDWIEMASDWLAPIYRRMLVNLRRGRYLQADETPIRCNDPDEKAGGTTQGWLWVISRPGGDVVFDWRLSRRHRELNSLLLDYQGVLQAGLTPRSPKTMRASSGWAAGRMRGASLTRRRARIPGRLRSS